MKKTRSITMMTGRGVVGWERVGMAFPHLFLAWERVPMHLSFFVVYFGDGNWWQAEA